MRGCCRSVARGLSGLGPNEEGNAMRNANRFRPSPALVISLIALFVSVSGVAWAAATIGTDDIKNGAVTTEKLHNNSVNTQKIVDGAVTAPKLHNNAVTNAKIAS